MTKMIQVIEEMDARLSQIADAENELVRALGHPASWLCLPQASNHRNLSPSGR